MKKSICQKRRQFARPTLDLLAPLTDNTDEHEKSKKIAKCCSDCIKTFF